MREHRKKPQNKVPKHQKPVNAGQEREGCKACEKGHCNHHNHHKDHKGGCSCS